MQNSKAFLEFEPLYTMTYGAKIFDKILYTVISSIFNLVNKTHNQIYLYSQLWRNIINRKHLDLKEKKVLFRCICGLG